MHQQDYLDFLSGSQIYYLYLTQYRCHSTLNSCDHTIQLCECQYYMKLIEHLCNYMLLLKQERTGDGGLIVFRISPNKLSLIKTYSWWIFFPMYLNIEVEEYEMLTASVVHHHWLNVQFQMPVFYLSQFQ